LEEKGLRTFKKTHNSYSPFTFDPKNPNNGYTMVTMRVNTDVLHEVWNRTSILTTIALLGGLFSSLYAGVAVVLQYHNWVLVRGELIKDMYRT